MDIRPKTGSQTESADVTSSEASRYVDKPDLKLFLLGLLISPIGIIFWHHDRKITPKRARSALHGVLLAAFIYVAIVAFIVVFGRQVYRAQHPGWNPGASQINPF